MYVQVCLLSNGVYTCGAERKTGCGWFVTVFSVDQFEVIHVKTLMVCKKKDQTAERSQLGGNKSVASS